jgi:hypothetical protein
MLPTPRTTDVEGGKASGVKNDGNGWYRENKKGERWGVKLRDVVENGMLPTPTATDWKGAYPPTSINNNKARKHMMRNIYHKVQEDHQYHSKNSQLNPLFVEEMMGFPESWTVLPFLGGEKNQ